MTVIAYRDGVMVSDKLSVGQYACGKTTKIRKIKGDLIGISGKTALAKQLFEWFENGATPDSLPKAQEDKETHAIIIRVVKHSTNKIEILIYDSPSAVYWVNEAQYHAIGSGQEFAMGAMGFKATALEAVLVACKESFMCGNGIDIIRFEGADGEVSTLP